MLMAALNCISSEPQMDSMLTSNQQLLKSGWNAAPVDQILLRPVQTIILFSSYTPFPMRFRIVIKLGGWWSVDFARTDRGAFVDTIDARWYSCEARASLNYSFQWVKSLIRCLLVLSVSGAGVEFLKIWVRRNRRWGVLNLELVCRGEWVNKC